MKKIIFKGCGTAIATPFDENGVNFKVFGDLIEKQISEGVDSIIVCGTTGEAATMTEQERKDTIKFVVDKVNKRIPVIAGTGSNNTKAAIEMTKYVESLGVDGALVVTPYYNKTTQKGLIEHYSAIASNTKLPIIVYSVPSRTGVNITPETCLELSKIENIVAIKEASGNISQVAKIASLCGDNLKIYSGNDDQIVPVLSVGGIGVISVLSNIYPKYTHEMVYDYLNGNVAEATKKQLACLDMVDNLFSEVNPIPVKAALNMIGYDYGIPRLPLIEMSKDKQAKLKETIDNFRV
ncbi:MAG: 4-hydroxy-tetrahydrodipicolinate synthase [Clostridia bacterium]|nr:4-hydroxy-tetrahydrodipicolinate synthase [Clostridia bacterium]